MTHQAAEVYVLTHRSNQIIIDRTVNKLYNALSLFGHTTTIEKVRAYVMLGFPVGHEIAQIFKSDDELYAVSRKLSSACRGIKPLSPFKTQTLHANQKFLW